VDLKIAHDDATRLRARCQTTTLQVVGPDQGYEAGALAPGPVWESIMSALAAQLQPDPDADHRRVVELIRPPDGHKPERFADLADQMGDPDADYLGHYTSAPKQPTTTPNPANGLFVGIHVDNFDRLDYASKHLGRRRLGINLGPGHRHLLVADHDIRAIARTVHRDHQRRYPHTDDLRAYAAAGRPIRLLRLRLDPGEGYVAPTELLPHDGSTEDATEPSTMAFWLGCWPLRRLPWIV
jgi:hypothetical protein